MKITATRLRQIIREELKVVSEDESEKPVSGKGPRELDVPEDSDVSLPVDEEEFEAAVKSADNALYEMRRRLG